MISAVLQCGSSTGSSNEMLFKSDMLDGYHRFIDPYKNYKGFKFNIYKDTTRQGVAHGVQNR